MSTILSYEDIQQKLTQRYPMLLLDRAQIVDEKTVYGLKNLSMNEEFFQGHFPSKPIMPGVLQVEAMYQTALLLCAEKLDPTKTKEVFLKSLSRVKFRKPVTPGDRLFLTAHMESIQEEIAVFKVSAKSEQGVTCQANLVVGVREKIKVNDFPAEFNESEFKPAMVDAMGIEEHIPHRFPFMFIDQVYEMEDLHTICAKNITGNEPFMHGYASQFSTVPSSIMCEMFAQSGCTNMLANPHNRGRIAYFAAINEFENLGPVYPGDKLIFDLVLPPADTKIGKCSGVAKVGDREVAKVVLMFAIGEKIAE